MTTKLENWELNRLIDIEYYLTCPKAEGHSHRTCDEVREMLADTTLMVRKLMNEKGQTNVAASENSNQTN